MFEANSCGVLSAFTSNRLILIKELIEQAKEEQGAGDQGMMFGYATNETAEFMPLALKLSHQILQELADLRRENKRNHLFTSGCEISGYFRIF